MKYFAYGSCLNTVDFRSTVNDFTITGTGRLENYRLVFNVWSNGRKCGVLNIIPSPGDYVLGVIYDIPDDKVYKLNEREGAPYFYRQETVTVNCNGTEHEVVTYIVVDKSDKCEFCPSKEYKEIVLSGMKEHNFPEDYIKRNLSSRVVCERCGKYYAEGVVASSHIRPLPVYICSNCKEHNEEFALLHFRNQMASWFFVFINPTSGKPQIYTFDYKTKKTSLLPWKDIFCPYEGEHDYDGFVSLFFPYAKRKKSVKIDGSKDYFNFHNTRLLDFQDGNGRIYSINLDNDHFCPGCSVNGKAHSGYIPFKIEWNMVYDFIHKNEFSYFAFDEDMTLSVFAEKYGEPLKREKAVLFDYRPAFSGGMMNVIPCMRECVEGVLYDVTEEQMEKIRSSGYYFMKLPVESYSKSTRALVRICSENNEEFSAPSENYLNFVLEGIKENKLTRRYENLIRKISKGIRCSFVQENAIGRGI